MNTIVKKIVSATAGFYKWEERHSVVAGAISIIAIGVALYFLTEVMPLMVEESRLNNYHFSQSFVQKKEVFIVQ